MTRRSGKWNKRVEGCRKQILTPDRHGLPISGTGCPTRVQARHRDDPGDRKQRRVDYQRQGFIIPAPDAPWVECVICDVQDDGLRVDAGSLAVPDIFAVSFTSGGEVVRLCRRVSRRGRLIGARFVTTDELRGVGVPQAS